MVGLSSSQFEKVFPFHLALDSALQIIQIGPSLGRIVGAEVMGTPVQDWFHLIRPQQAFSLESLRQSEETVCVMEVKGRSVRLRGQFVSQSEGGVVFLGAPWATSLEPLTEAGISLFTDYAVHDPTVDLLHLVQLQRTTQEDQGRLVERLSAQRAELRETSARLTQELSERIRAEALTRSILDTAADAIIMIDDRGLIQSVNPAGEKLFGFSSQELLGSNVTLLMNEEDARHHDAYLQRYLETGVAHILGEGREVTGRRRNGELFPMLLSVGVVHVEGQRRFTGILRDITQQKLQQERLQADESRLRSVLGHMLEALLFFDAEGILRLCNPVAGQLLGVPPDMLIGQSLPQMQQSNVAFASLLHGIQAATVMDEVRCSQGRFLERECVPVPQGDNRVGILVLLRDITERRKGQQALVQAREQEVEIAGRIQKTLLFGTSPIGLEGIEVATLTRPSQAVDGDFFEFYRYGGETLDIVIADVMGKGIAAALLGAAAKTHLQAAAVSILGERRAGIDHQPSPVAIVNRLHTALSHQLISLNSFITLCYARLDLRERTLQFVDCGHPQTLLLRADGKVECLQGPNVPLGFLPQERYESVTVPLQTGDTLVFYSDGLTETTSGQGEQFGSERLVEFLLANLSLDISHLIEGLQKELADFQGDARTTDDLTCVIARVGPPPEKVVRAQRHLEFSSDLNELPIIRRFVSDVLDAYFPETPETEIYNLSLAVNEASSNIMRHAYHGRSDGWIHLDCRVGLDWIGFRLYHRGLPLDPESLESVSPVTEPQLGGMGLFLIQTYCDEVSCFSDSQGRHCFSMVRYLPVNSD